MTILLLHNHYRIRGGEDSVFEAERDMLRAAGHYVETWEKHNDELQEHGGPIGKIRLFFRTLWNRDAYRELRERLARNRPDVVHVHNFFPQFSPSVFWACAKEKVPVVLTLHNYRLACLNGYLYRSPKSKVRNPKSEIRDPRFEIRDSKSEIKDSKSEIQDLKFEIRDLQSGICEKCLGKCPWPGVARRCYRDSLSASFTLAAMLLLHRALGTWRRKVDRFIALTEFSKKKFMEAGLPADKIVVKPNAVDVPFPAATPAPHDGLRVIYIGRLSSEKGVDVLVRAWNLLRENAKPVPNAELWIVGDGPERDTLEHLASASPALPIRFFGAKPHAEALDLLRQSDLLVLPSVWYETFGLTVMEAAALGVPSVVSHGGIPASLIHDGETGRTFQMGNPADLASVLLELFLSPKALARMGNAARNRYDICNCRPVANVARVVDLYQSSIENHTSMRRPSRWSLWVLAIFYAVYFTLVSCLTFYPSLVEESGYRYLNGDVAQYYMGAMAVKAGLPQCLYPDSGDKSLYQSGQVREPLATILESKGWIRKTVYIYPPPLGWILQSMASMTYPAVCLCVFAVNALSLFLVLAWVLKRSQKVGLTNLQSNGLVLLLGCSEPMLSSFWYGNLEPLLMLFVTMTLYGLLQKRTTSPVVGFIGLALTKGFSVPWVPFLFIRKRGAVLLWGAIASIFLLACSGYALGPDVFFDFFERVLPESRYLYGIGLGNYGLPSLLAIIGILSKWEGWESGLVILNAIQLLLFLFTYWCAWRKRREPGYTTTMQGLFACTVITILFSPISWSHNAILLVPFVPLLLATTKQRKAHLVSLALVFLPIGYLLYWFTPFWFFHYVQSIGYGLMLVCSLKELTGTPSDIS